MTKFNIGDHVTVNRQLASSAMGIGKIRAIDPDDMSPYEVYFMLREPNGGHIHTEISRFTESELSDDLVTPSNHHAALIRGGLSLCDTASLERWKDEAVVLDLYRPFGSTH